MALLFSARALKAGVYTALLLCCLMACASEPGPKTVSSYFCSVNGINIRTDFESASLHACSEGESGPVLTIAPEFAPINPSPWYAYEIGVADHSDGIKMVHITQNYIHGKHRYRPWIRTPGGEWELLRETGQQVSEDLRTFQYDLQVPPEGLQVAAQPLLTATDSLLWSEKLARDHGLKITTLLRTQAGHAIQLYENTASGNQTILLLGRQHPPEVTGAFAYQDFVARLFEADALTEAFQQRFHLVMVPMMNPDGVARGHWRMNTRGADLNRDWGPFTQPETRAIFEWLKKTATDTRLTMLLDFHSTWSDVFYGQHPADEPKPHGFNRAWYQAIQTRLGKDTPPWSGQNNPGLPTAKSWARREYGISAITYEVGDQTPRTEIRYKARVAAEELMRTLMSMETPQDESSHH